MTTLEAQDTQKAVRTWIEDIAGSRKPGETLKDMLARVSRTTQVRFSRLRAIWYGETSNISWHEAENLRIRAVHAQETRDRWADIARRNSLAALKTEIRRVEDYGAQIARRREVSRRPDMAGKSDQPDSQFHFWLGGQDSDLDRTGGE